ncbi:hypothetical protein F5880DRAFT_696319 [Lentinula raphanica]|nr:hypothetical protein F5880DRAFT_696319 [Lentinula raphanica]
MQIWHRKLLFVATTSLSCKSARKLTALLKGRIRVEWVFHQQYFPKDALAQNVSFTNITSLSEVRYSLCSLIHCIVSSSKSNTPGLRETSDESFIGVEFHPWDSSV